MSAGTIVGIATGPVASGVGILRVSGPAALAASRALAKDLPEQPEPRRAYLTRVMDLRGGLLDEGLALFFRAPHSYTGEDVVELQTHGSPRLLKLLQDELLADGRVRLAEPGEFTRRAYLNGRIDLTRAEAVADLVTASTEAAVRAAAAQLKGALLTRVEALYRPLLALRADLEGVLSFPDEAEGAEAQLSPRLSTLAREARALLAAVQRGALLRRGARVALFGPANAGKSTLFNALIGEERALVDAEPGTTRDVLEARLELDGLPVVLLDTAGLREPAGRVEGLGVARARAAVRESDLAVLVLPPEDRGASGAWAREAGDTPVLVVLSKADLGPPPRDGLAVSGRTGAGVEALRRAIAERLFSDELAPGVRMGADRHFGLLARAVEALKRAETAASVSTLEVVAGELSLAQGALGQVTGADVDGALLDEIFGRFCIGK